MEKAKLPMSQDAEPTRNEIGFQSTKVKALLDAVMNYGAILNGEAKGPEGMDKAQLQAGLEKSTNDLLTALDEMKQLAKTYQAILAKK